MNYCPFFHQIPIDRNIPMPSPYPFYRMEVGDSFFVPDHLTQDVRRVCYQQAGRKFATRVVAGGLRIWRIA